MLLNLSINSLIYKFSQPLLKLKSSSDIIKSLLYILKLIYIFFWLQHNVKILFVDTKTVINLNPRNILYWIFIKLFLQISILYIFQYTPFQLSLVILENFYLVFTVVWNFIMVGLFLLFIPFKHSSCICSQLHDRSVNNPQKFIYIFVLNFCTMLQSNDLPKPYRHKDNSSNSFCMTQQCSRYFYNIIGITRHFHTGYQ